MAIHETELNIAIAAALDGMRRTWRVAAERKGVISGSSKRPDIVIERRGLPPILIENEFMPARGAEKEARARLGLELAKGNRVGSVIALCSPSDLEKLGKGKQLSELVKAGGAGYQYALLTGENPQEATRFPESGWLTGNLVDLAEFAYAATFSAKAVESAVLTLQNRVQIASAQMDDAIDFRADIPKRIGELLRQEYGDGEQTRRMVMLILINAFVFHHNLAGYEGICDIANLQNGNGNISRDELLKEWEKILKINYWPIFHIAREILKIIPAMVAQRFINDLNTTSKSLVDGGIALSHDISGRVFQRLIADRKFLATFYTRPPSAALLAHLAIPAARPFEKGTWKKHARDYTVADFACGTGTLLSAAYQRIAELVEHEGGDSKETHPAMMEQAITGCDVMPAAVHLTASMLSGMHPDIKFKGTRLFTLAYGKGKDDEYATGSLELLGEQSVLPVFDTGMLRQTGAGEMSAKTHEIKWRSTNLVIMNPPFTRATNHEGAHKEIPNPVWAGFGMDAAAQKKIAAKSASLRKGTCAHGNAGIASDFIALADKMVLPDGITAFVLPLSVLAGESWKNVRTLWANNYRDIRVVTIAAQNSDECSFSADTGMAEMLFIGKKTNNGNGNGGKPRPVPRRGIFTVLHKRPENEIEAGEHARAIKRAMLGKVRKLEDGPVGGTRIFAGEEYIGEILDAPFPQTAEDAWGVSRIRDMTLAQVAYSLTEKQLNLPGQKQKRALAVCKLGEFAERGFIARDINGTYMGNPRGPFDIATLHEGAGVPTYPCLWAHDAKKETQLIVAPDSEGVIRPGMEKRAGEVWKSASRIHHNSDFRFNSQPLAVATSAKPTIGGIAWPNVILKNRGQEAAYALWGNSTPGILLYWWQANKQQSGRGRISPSRVPEMPFLDLRKLSPSQLAAAKKGFDEIKARKFLPFHLAHEDDSRKLLDKIILVDVLGLPKSVLDGVALVREKLAREPSVRGGKD